MVKRRLSAIYKQLYRQFGPQYWWPGQTSFEVIVGAILTQNTNWANVEKAINNLKRERVLNANKIFQMRQAKLARLIRPAGYYNIKAKRLKNFINFLFFRYRGSLKRLFRQDIVSLRKELLFVNGIGEETADSIILYAAKLPIFVVDAYTLRIFSRHNFFKGDSPYYLAQKFFMQNLKENAKMFNEFHALIVKLGKEFCRKNNPKCGICPIRNEPHHF